MPIRRLISLLIRIPIRIPPRTRRWPAAASATPDEIVGTAEDLTPVVKLGWLGTDKGVSAAEFRFGIGRVEKTTYFKKTTREPVTSPTPADRFYANPYDEFRFGVGGLPFGLFPDTQGSVSMLRVQSMPTHAAPARQTGPTVIRVTVPTARARQPSTSNQISSVLARMRDPSPILFAMNEGNDRRIASFTHHGSRWSLYDGCGTGGVVYDRRSRPIIE